MLEITIGQAGSFCDNCGSPTRKGYELKGPISSIFYCEVCAERKFGEAETQRAIRKIVDAQGREGTRLSSVISPLKGEPMQLRPVGFMRR